MDILLVIMIPVLALLIPTAYAGYIGAPYAPTFMAVVKKTFDNLKVGSEDVVVDLGAGDGRIMLDAAARGARTIGYKLSPILWLVAWWRLWGQKEAKIFFRNFYKQKLPPETTLIFIFLMPNHMGEVRDFLAKQSLPNAHYVLAYAFPFPSDITPVTIVREPKCAPLYVYDWDTVAQYANQE